ncbi:MAG: hypothetical protein L6R38_006184 [Xanthoria sp. 2 TBL-2021]|nr:MAG: hypothetical protein L6R38_006184 [Xanthoria sp. 2 TBL-2021]
MSTLHNSTANDPLRRARLNKFFSNVNHGERSLKITQDGNRYIEALCCQPDPAACVQAVVSTPAGLQALQISLRFDISDAFLNGATSDLLTYLQHPDLESLLGGVLLRQVLESITTTPIFWNALVQSYRRGSLQVPTQVGFAWLLLQLMYLPTPACAPYHQLAQDPKLQDSFLKSSELELRTIGSKIKHVLSISETPAIGTGGGCAGGRHDNDFADFREVAILPTADELAAKEPPFLRLAESLDDPEAAEHRLAMHLDNQFRLYREDMLGELREEIQIALGQKKGRHRGIVINGLVVLGVDCGTETKRQSWGLRLQCHQDLPQLRDIKPKARKTFLESSHNLLRHQSLTCLILDGEITAFPSIHRDIDLLAAIPPVLSIKFINAANASIAKTLLKLKTCKIIRLVQIDTAVFAYEPVLQSLQRMKTLPLADELLFWTSESDVERPPKAPSAVIDRLVRHPSDDLQKMIQSSKPVVLDRSQNASLIASLGQTVSLIQGPPGTGKSFIGALAAKTIYQFTKKTILVVCFTNHALDQFLEDLLDVGIPESTMLRLGNIGRATSRLRSLGLREQASASKLTPAAWSAIQQLKALTNHLSERLSQSFDRYIKTNVSKSDLMEYLEFLDDDINYYEAFTIPRSQDGSSIVGKRGKAINDLYLIDQWCSGQNRGVFSSSKMTADAVQIWAMPGRTRHTIIAKWYTAILEDRVSELSKIAAKYDKAQRELDETFKTKNIDIIKSKRVIGCTTTAAAKYAHELRAASRDVLLVEEAGEILESHVITALGEKTTQLILIGDHKQLRPKVANYELTVERGEGYDLNRSMFERLVLKGFPHQVLTQQHRMRPEISSLVRSITYPDLLDAPKTKGRPSLRGFQDNLIFVDHRQLERDIRETANWRDMTSLSSKQNQFEAEMVLKCVKYLAQQGYGSEDIVVLTPYLGQLRLLQEVLSSENDPVLNDLDTADLVRAGLVPPSTNQQSRRKLRLACIDNYQGEESDIVIVTLTRSNTNCDIGFMIAPERLNVLLSRARDALLIIGNSETFLGTRKGKPVWEQLFKMLEAGKHMYTGFPVECMRHPRRKTFLSTPAEFDAECPDGGCKEPCKGHVLTWKCFQRRPKDCPICVKAAAAEERKRVKDLKLKQKRDEEAEAHARRLAEIDSKLEAQRQEGLDLRLSEERALTIRQKEKDLASAISQAIRTKLAAFTQQNIQSQNESSPTEDKGKTPISTLANDQSVATGETAHPITMRMDFTSESRNDWQHQKQFENAANEAIDEIMDLVGLEDIKSQVLRIKAKIDTSKRQHSDVKKERFNAAFLGNPGTGKTTVARLYARVLTSLEVLPGVAFVETSGSRLAHGGVGEAKKHIEDLQKAGGGAMFLDEAYQLAQKHTPGGRQVLDFLLAEMENNVGKIVFIVAGYSREMENFFEHNPGLPSRIPYRLRFEDYKDFELLWFLQQQIHKKWEGKMKIEGGHDGLYMRVAVRRVGRGRGRPGFGNARALEIVFSKITERQADRLKRERKQGKMPNDFWLSKEDLIGPEPSLEAIHTSTAWQKVQGLTGLQAVKDSLHVMVQRIVSNYQRELKEKEPIEVSLNRVFLGNPGTGKTSVAKLYGQILADLGLLSNGEVVAKNPSDFVGQYIGQSESNTKAILASAVGKVLIIDEAYMLYTGNDGGGNQSDSFKTGVIDTIVAEVQSVPGEDRCVLLLGYRDKMETMFRNVNPGLSRRFRIDDAFQFDDFSEPELRAILESKMKQQDLDATGDAMIVAMEVLNRSKIRPHFGNAGEVENLLGSAKDRFQKRQNAKPVAERSFDFVFEQQDFDPEFDRVKHANDNLKVLFGDTVGCEEIIAKLAGYQQIVQGMKARDIDPRGQIPMNFLFKGPPGTGKTTTARKMGQVYYDMGFLSSAEVFECSASDLVGQYVGHTGPKTVAQLEKALGKILFIDEAYRLSEGHFAAEATNELVDQLTKPQYLNKIVVILAGYDKDINKLISTNPGLSSRFPEEIIFQNMSPERCIELLTKKLGQKHVAIPTLNDIGSSAYRSMCDLFKQLAALPSFGNGREVETLAKTMLGFIYRQPVSGGTLTLTLDGEDALRLTKTMLHERQDRSANMPNTSIEMLPRAKTATADPRPPWASGAPPSTAREPNTNDASTEDPSTDPQASAQTDQPTSSDDYPSRDPGVSDEIWNQLQLDAQTQEAKQRQETADLQAREKAFAKAEALEAERKLALDNLAKQKAKDDAEREELKRRREAARLAEHRARMERERVFAELEKVRVRKEQEVKAQRKLREMGVCVAGFRWIKQASGYRCAGGSHFVSDRQLGL